MENAADYQASMETMVRQRSLTEVQSNSERRATEYEQKIAHINDEVANLERKVSMGISALREAETLLLTMDRIDTPEKSASARRKILLAIQATLRELQTP